MNMNELATAVTENIPIAVLIMNNGVLGMVRQWQKLFYKERYSNTELNRKTDFVKLAEAFGAKGLRVLKKDQVRFAVETALTCGGPCVIDFVVDRKENVLSDHTTRRNHKRYDFL